jgi:hypothetical protein
MKTLYASLLSVFFMVTTFTQSSNAQVTATSNSTAIGVTLANFQALQNANAVHLAWSAMGESNMSSHEVQKSANGSAFTAIGNIPAQNNGTSFRYTYIDATPVDGNNYYRLRSVDKRGNITFSNILRVNSGFRQNELVVLPNPVTSGVLNLQLANFNSGRYNISLYSNAGQKVFARSMNFSEGSSTETINLPTNLSRGMYFLQVTDGSNRINKQVMLQ